MIPILRSTPSAIPSIEQHLLALEPPDRFLRFCSNASDDSIHTYVASLNLSDDDVGFHCINDRLDVVGFVHIAVCGGTAELGISVSNSERGRGIGGALFDRAVAFCVATGITVMYMNCLAANAAMQHIARSRNIKTITEYGVSEGAVDLSDRNALLALADSWAHDGLGLYDLNWKLVHQLLTIATTLKSS